MAEEWYYTEKGKQVGPVSAGRIQKMVASGELKPTDLVWNKDMPKWVRAATVPSLFPEDGAMTASVSTPAPAAAPPAAHKLPVPTATTTRTTMTRDRGGKSAATRTVTTRRMTRATPEANADVRGAASLPAVAAALRPSPSPWW